MIPQYSSTENAYGEEVTTQSSVSTETSGDCLVVEFFNRRPSQSEAGPAEREGKVGAPLTVPVLTISRDDVPRCRIKCYRRQ